MPLLVWWRFGLPGSCWIQTEALRKSFGEAIFLNRPLRLFEDKREVVCGHGDSFLEDEAV